MIWKVILYLALVMLVTILLALLQRVIHLNGENISLPQLAPAMSLLILAAVYKDLRIPVSVALSKPTLVRSLIALGFPLLIFSIAFIIGKSIGLEMELTRDFIHLASSMLPGILIGAAGEEIGWRSFLQPMFERKHSMLVSSAIVGLVWGLWHMGHYGNGLLFMMGFLLFTVSASIILARLLRDTAYNIVISVFFHVSVNICFLTFFKKSLTTTASMVLIGITWLVALLGLMVLFRKMRHVWKT